MAELDEVHARRTSSAIQSLELDAGEAHTTQTECPDALMADGQSMCMTREEGIREVLGGRRHVVILGAGASIAANLHNPEPSGKKLPSMANLIDVVGLADIIDAAGSGEESGNFEKIYSRLHTRDPGSRTVTEIEKRVADYFRSLTLPSTPTIYDYLLLALRPKDLVATFNWDPFLYEAFCRNGHVAGMPSLSFLHGSVSIGFSPEEQERGPAGWISKATGHEYVPTRLLYPVTQKDYNRDEFIKREWDRLGRWLEQAARITIFGYGAPDTDVEAVELMSRAWGHPDRRNLEQVEMIDVQPKDVLTQRWSRFIHSGHYDYCTSYFQSILALFPRRTGESFMHQFCPSTEAEALQELNPVPERFDTLEAMWEWHRPLIEAESEHTASQQVGS